MVESLQGRDRPRCGLVVPHALPGRAGVAQCGVDEPDIARVFIARDAVPNFRRVLQVRLGLPDQLGNLVEAVDDVPIPLRRRCVLQHIRRVETVAQQLDIARGIVAVALDLIELQTRRAESVVHDIDIGTLLRVERRSIEPRDPRFDVARQASRGRDPRRTEIIQHVIERCAVMDMVAKAPPWRSLSAPPWRSLSAPPWRSLSTQL